MRTVRADQARPPRAATTCPAVAIAGYTNAGKSSLLNRLTGAGVLVEDALFATLDPTTRRARHRRRPGLHPLRHGRLRPAPAAPDRRGVPLDARGGGRGRPGRARGGRGAPRPGGAGPGGPRGARRGRRGQAARAAGGEQDRRRRRGDAAAAQAGVAGRRLRLGPDRAGHRRAARGDRGAAAPAGGRAAARCCRTTGATWSPGCIGAARCSAPHTSPRGPCCTSGSTRRWRPN